MIALIARLTAKEGQEQELEKVLLELGAQVREKEPGCKLYQLCKTQTPRQLVMIERYETHEAFAAHSKTDHFRAMGARLAAVLDGRPAIEVLQEVTG